MIQVGDLIQHKRDGKIGIVTRRTKLINYCHVHFHDGTYTVHINNLKLLEKK